MTQPKHTVVAGQAIGLAELFKFTVGKNKIDGGTTTYSPELSAPDGPSTAGGKQALQHLKLVPADGGPAIVIGAANLVEKQAEVRSFEHIDDAYRARFRGASFPVDMIKYNTLQLAIRKFFTDRDFTVATAAFRPTQSVPAAAPAASAAPRPTTMSGTAAVPGASSTNKLLIVIAVILAIAVAVMALKG